MIDRYVRTVVAATAFTFACAPAPEGPAWTLYGPPPRIVIDGAFDEWSEKPVSATAAGHESAPAIREVRTSADGEALFLGFMLSSPVVLQAHTAATRIVLDIDGSATTGRALDGVDGADIVLEFSPAPAAGRTRGGFAARTAAGRAGTAHDAGFSTQPTHASRTFESRIERALIEAFVGVRVGSEARGRIISDVESGSSVASPMFIWRVPPAGAVAVPAGPDALARAANTAVRVVAWNVADRTIHERPEVFARVLRALAPDVLLLDELPAATDSPALAAFLAGIGPDWRFALGAGGGRQRAAVASRLPLEPARGFERVGYPDSVRALLPLATFPQTQRDLRSAPTDGLSTAGAIVDVGGRRVLFVAADLACCGGEESVEDRFRRIQADAIRRAATEAAAHGRVHAIVVGGDLNLVGSRRPFEILAREADPRGGDLEPVYALQLDGRTAATWRQDGPFGPGRLDWILYSASTLAVARAFVFESRDLSVASLSALGLDAADSEVTSDHLPVVADFVRVDARR